MNVEKIPFYDVPVASHGCVLRRVVLFNRHSSSESATRKNKLKETLQTLKKGSISSNIFFFKIQSLFTFYMY